jgi:hypothetical protein
LSAALCHRALGGQRRLGNDPCQGRQPPEAGAEGPPLQGSFPSHTDQLRSAPRHGFPPSLCGFTQPPTSSVLYARPSRRAADITLSMTKFYLSPEFSSFGDFNRRASRTSGPPDLTRVLSAWRPTEVGAECLLIAAKDRIYRDFVDRMRPAAPCSVLAILMFGSSANS